MAPDGEIARVLSALEEFARKGSQSALGHTELERVANFSRRWAYREMLEAIRSLKRDNGLRE